jgi:hypothetical protein
MKTNDVTGLFPRGLIGVAIEMGRPGLGTSFKDVQTMTMALAELKVDFTPASKCPVTDLMVDLSTGELETEVLNERALSVIIEFSAKRERLEEIIKAVREVSARIDTVFSLDLISRVDDDGAIPVLPTVRAAGLTPLSNCKTNLGLGRPLIKEA